MSTQLSFLEPITAPRRYKRDRYGRFASKDTLELEKAKQSAMSYRRMYEAEKRKIKPIIRRLIRVERELYNLKHKL